MIVGVSRVSFHLPGNNSLKGKRKNVKGLVDRIRAKFNAAVAEVAENDTLQKAVIGISVVGNDGAHVDSMLGRINNFIEGVTTMPVAAFATEIIHMGDHLEQDLSSERIGDEEAFPWENEEDKEW